jgi:hypothetical protein
MIRPQTITLYAVENYAQPLEKGKMEVSYDEAIKLLLNDQDKVSYHIRLYNNTTIYPLYCDIDDDGTPEKGLAPALDEILKIFNDMYEKVIISKSDTTQKNSYHLIFPQYQATIETQKHYWEKFNKSNYGCVVDMNVYKTSYFRLPNQLKPYSGGSVSGLIPETRHRVIEGSINDFLFENYEGAQTLISPTKGTDSTEETRSRSRSSSTEHVPSTEIAKYIDCLSEKRATDHKTWIEVMCCLRNIEINQDENLEYFITFSKKYNLHDSDSDLTKKYIRNKSKTAEEKAFRIGSLKMWAMEDNPELYKKHFPVKCLLDSDSSDDDYAFTEWEKTHCKILNPPSYLEHKIDEHSHDEIFIIRNTTALEQSFNHLTIDEKSINKKGDEVSKKKSFIKTWINLNDKIRLFDKIGVYPHPLICPPNQYNCWSKFRGDLLPEVSLEYNKELDTFKKLLRVLCNHEEVAYVYLEKWIAQAIQYPANKTTVPTIISKQGAGKGTLIKLITAILGDKKVLSTTNADTVFGRFNNQMLNAYLVNLDELSPKDVKDCEGKIKGLITEPTISIDIKGVSSVTIKSHHRFINTTNNEFGVFKTEFGDRRNFIVRASDELIGNKQFFENFNNNIIENNNVVKYIYNYLKSIPNLDVFHLANNIPKTSYSEELKEAARTDYDHWLEDFTKRYSDTGTDQFSSKFLYDDFIAFVKKDNFNNKSFGIRIINIVPNAITRGKHDRNGENKLFNWKVLKEHYKTDCLLDDDSDDDLSNASTI